jgi:hypothetical protein
MTVQQQHLPHPLSSGTDYQALAARFRPIFARIAAGALEREQSRSLPFEQVKCTGVVGAPNRAARVAAEDRQNCCHGSLIRTLVLDKTALFARNPDDGRIRDSFAYDAGRARCILSGLEVPLRKAPPRSASHPRSGLSRRPCAFPQPLVDRRLLPADRVDRIEHRETDE